MAIETVFLDAGGVLVYPNWKRVSAALAARGVRVDKDVLARAEPLAKKSLDVASTINATNDNGRGWLYFNLVLEHAGVPLSPATDAALAELHDYHAAENLWETVPAGVPEALAGLRALGLRLVVVSNANGRLRHLFTRLDLADLVDVMFDSFEEGVEKPDPALFQIALERSGGEAATTVHVGDLYHVDVIGARAAGLIAVLLDTADLYAGCDCPRIRTLGELATLVSTSDGLRAIAR
jgi:putative hydrolase of the HAD superfamily